MPERPNPRLKILARPAFSSGGRNPYTTLLYRQMQTLGHAVFEYSSARAVCGRYDVVHVHWPESVFNHTLAEAWVTTEALLVGLRAARARGAKVVWTIHNLRAHERRHPVSEKRFRERFFACLDGVISLSQAGLDAAREAYPALRKLPAWIVSHPHYRGQYPDTVTRSTARSALQLPDSARVLLAIGRVFEYKNFQALVKAVKSAPETDWLACIAGEPRDAGVARTLSQLAADDPRIRLDFAFITDDQMQLYLRAANLVVQPYREILNSGTALLALSFDRPVLLPASGAGVELTRSPGAPWVLTFEGELTPDDVRRSLQQTATLPETSDGQQLVDYTPERVGQQLATAFRELTSP